MEKRRIKKHDRKGPGKWFKREKTGIGLNGVFWRYLLTSGFLAAALCAVWLILFNILVNMGFVLSAYTAVRGLTETERALQGQAEFNPEGIPHFYEWALVEDGRILESSMNQKQLEYAREELAGSSAPHGWFYSQYFHLVPLESGQTVMLEYDYSVCYADPDLNEVLPDFQTVYIGLLLALLAVSIALCTGHYAKILREDTRAIAEACEMVRKQELELPLPGQARVRELQASLETIGLLRRELSHSLKEQWAAEQRKNEALAALAHDLKTPLTVIGGNAELLAEEGLEQPQQELVLAILRNAGHAEEYVKRLRQVTSGAGFPADRGEVPVCELLEACMQKGQDLAVLKDQKVIVDPSVSDLSGKSVIIEKSEVLRAMENLISNAVRFAPVRGTIMLGVEFQADQTGLWVQDSGPGFSAEALVKAGRTFYTQDGSRPQDGHMGMGLYFASQIAQKHGGSLSVENTSIGGRACLWIQQKPPACPQE